MWFRNRFPPSFCPPMSHKGLLYALLHFRHLLLPIILPCNIFSLPFLIGYFRQMTSAGFFFPLILIIFYEQGFSALIPLIGGREHAVWGIFRRCLVRMADVNGKVLLMMIRFIYQGHKRCAKNAYFDSHA